MRFNIRLNLNSCAHHNVSHTGLYCCSLMNFNLFYWVNYSLHTTLNAQFSILISKDVINKIYIYTIQIHTPHSTTAINHTTFKCQMSRISTFICDSILHTPHTKFRILHSTRACCVLLAIPSWEKSCHKSCIYSTFVIKQLE